MTVVGWCDLYGNTVPTATFTSERRKALVERIRKRRYNFNHQDYCFLPYCSPVYNDKTTCELTKAQWDSVMDEAYGDIRRGQRLLPQDIITQPAKNGILFEKEKFIQEGEHSDG